MRSVRVEWEGPFCLDYVIDELNGKDDYGIYQIYGTHIVYGASSLLYIGKAEGMTFSNNLSDMDQFYNSQIAFYLGYDSYIKGNLPLKRSSDYEKTDREAAY